MRRTLIQFDEQTYGELRKEAFRQERSLSSLVRELVSKGLDRGGAKKRPTRASQFASVGAGRSDQDRSAPVSEHHDAALAALFDK